MPHEKLEQAFGRWKSPIAAEHFAAEGSVMLTELATDRSHGKVYSLEIRADDGKGVLVEHNLNNKTSRVCLDRQFDCSSAVHEYGGSSFTYSEASGHIIFTDTKTKGVFGLDPGTAEVISIVEANKDIYYAGFNVHPMQPHLTVAIQERHDVAQIADIKNSLVVIDSSTRKVANVASGADFYTSPRFNHAGTMLCWIQFNFPNMPWDNTELWIADFEDGTTKNARCIAGEKTKASITQPRWAPDDVLYYVSDATNFWQIYAYHDGILKHLNFAGLESAEFGFADWFLGGSSYAFLTAETMVTCFNYQNRWTVISADTRTLSWFDLSCPVVESWGQLEAVSDTSFAIIGSTTSLPMLVTVIDINEGGLGRVLKVSNPKTIPEDYVSLPQPVTFPRLQNLESGEVSHGIFYPPKSASYKGFPGSLPSLIVAVHGGPTFQQGTGFSLRDHALTTRGYALLQVNYVGSTGYGRKYRDMLKGYWGDENHGDIADVLAGVRFLAQQGLIDAKRVGITGHSAGGYSTLQALAKFPDVWACGVAESGISDMKLLIEETHKFESQYLIPLCFQPGSSTTEQEAIIKNRSPITHASNIKAPLLIINGADDPIVPPNQARTIGKLVEEAGVPLDVKVYDGEAHMFTKGSTLVDIEERRYAWFEKYLARKDE